MHQEFVNACLLVKKKLSLPTSLILQLFYKRHLEVNLIQNEISFIWENKSVISIITFAKEISFQDDLIFIDDEEISDDENDENQEIDENNILMIGFVGVVGVALLLLILIIWFLMRKKKKKRNRKAFKGTNQVLSWDL